MFGLVSSVLRQEIGWEERLQNDVLSRVGCKAVVPCQNKIILKHFRPVGRPSYNNFISAWNHV